MSFPYGHALLIGVGTHRLAPQIDVPITVVMPGQLRKSCVTLPSAAIQSNKYNSSRMSAPPKPVFWLRSRHLPSAPVRVTTYCSSIAATVRWGPMAIITLEKVLSPFYADYRAEAFTGLVKHLSTELKMEALQKVQVISMASRHVERLNGLVKHLPSEVKVEVMRATLNVLRTIENASEWPVLHDALNAALWIDDDPDHIDQYANTLIRLAAYLPTELQVKAWRAAQEIWHKDWRSSALIGLVAYLPAELQSEALHEVRSISDNYTRALGLSRLAAP